jgi:hypothetical protein
VINRAFVVYRYALTLIDRRDKNATLLIVIKPYR